MKLNRKKNTRKKNCIVEQYRARQVNVNTIFILQNETKKIEISIGSSFIYECRKIWLNKREKRQHSFEKFVQNRQKKTKNQIPKSLTICNPLDTNSGVYDPFCIPFIDDVAVDPPFMTGVNCCHVEPCVLDDGWSECCCACDVSGGGEFTGVDGLLKLLILWSADVYIVCIALPTIVSFCIAGLCCECRCGWGLYNAGEFWPCGPVGGTGCVALPRNVLIGGNVCDWLCMKNCLLQFNIYKQQNCVLSPVSYDRLCVSHPVIRNNDRVHAVDPGVANGRHDGMT